MCVAVSTDSFVTNHEEITHEVMLLPDHHGPSNLDIMYSSVHFPPRNLLMVTTKTDKPS